MIEDVNIFQEMTENVNVLQALFEQLRVNQFTPTMILINPRDFKRHRAIMKAKRMVNRLRNHV